MIRLETKRLVLRKFEEEDWKDIYDYLSDETVIRFEPHEVFSEEDSKEEAQYRSSSDEFIAVCLKESNKVIGNLYFAKGDFDTYEFGYVFNQNYWHEGYATESANALLNYAFHNLGVRKVIAKCDPKNNASFALLERLKLRREGHFLKNVYFKTDEKNQPIWKDTYQYAILREDWVNIMD